MDVASSPPYRAPRFALQRVRPSRPTRGLLEDVRAGLLCAPRSLPPKYFYDDRGSRLFDRICDTPEYYPARSEAALLARHAGAIVGSIRPDHIFELGSGSARKTRHLLDACAAAGLTCTYWPFDVCEPMLVQAGAALLQEYPWLQVRALAGDYLGGLGHLPQPPGRRLFVFLGGTIGNFAPDEALGFLRDLRARMRPGDALLLGADRVKDPQVLHAAYNDAEGVTAEFNRNVLAVLNRELEADFDPQGFAHYAPYNPDQQQIEMYLIARGPQRARLGCLGLTLDLPEGERILTEVSRKFTPSRLRALLEAAGLALNGHYAPADEYFSLALAELRAPGA